MWALQVDDVLEALQQSGDWMTLGDITAAMRPRSSSQVPRTIQRFLERSLEQLVNQQTVQTQDNRWKAIFEN